MSSKVLGFVAGFAGVTALTSVGFAQSGNVPTCVTDDECLAGTWCPSAHSSDPGEGTAVDPEPASEPQPTRAALYFPAEGSAACEPIPEGVCESNDDCGAGLECVKSQSSAGCSPSVDGDTRACDTSVTTSRYGSCEFAPIECATDSDCPNGLSCVADLDEPVTDLPGCDSATGDCAVSSSGSGSGSTGSAVTKAATKYCNYVPEECTQDSDCTGNFECVISEVKACSGSGPTVDCGGIAEADGVAAEDCVVAEPREPECETVSTQGWCFPKKMPCSADAECPNEYVCYEFEAGLAPDEWNVSSSVMSCLPEGLALVARSDGDYTVVSDSKDEAASGSDDGSALHGRARGNGDGSACSVSSTRSGSTWLLSVIGLLGLCLVRRRTRAV